MNKLSNCRTGPKWTFSPRIYGQSQEQRQDNPGPGTYSHSAGVGNFGHKRSASYGFGTGVRDKMRPNSAVGPGQYAHESMRFTTKHRTPSWGFGTGSKDSAVSALSADVYGMPGPGEYSGDSSSTRKKQPQYSATPRRPMSAGASSAVPGPGSYEPSQAAKMGNLSASPKWRFGSSSRRQQEGNGTPGPGCYATKSSMGRAGPQYSMGAKLAVQRDDGYPGPGTFGDHSHFSQFN